MLSPFADLSPFVILYSCGSRAKAMSCEIKTSGCQASQHPNSPWPWFTLLPQEWPILLAFRIISPESPAYHLPTTA